MNRSNQLIYVPKILDSYISAYEKQEVWTLSDFATYMGELR